MSFVEYPEYFCACYSTIIPKMLSSYLDPLLSNRPALLISAFTLISSFTNGQTIPEIKATYGSIPAPFIVDVDPFFIATTNLKVSLSRIANDIGAANLVDGPSTEIAVSTNDFWVSEYNWMAVQDELNQKYESCILLYFEHS